MCQHFVNSKAAPPWGGWRWGGVDVGRSSGDVLCPLQVNFIMRRGNSWLGVDGVDSLVFGLRQLHVNFISGGRRVDLELTGSILLCMCCANPKSYPQLRVAAKQANCCIQMLWSIGLYWLLVSDELCTKNTATMSLRFEKGLTWFYQHNHTGYLVWCCMGWPAQQSLPFAHRRWRQRLWAAAPRSHPSARGQECRLR